MAKKNSTAQVPCVFQFLKMREEGACPERASFSANYLLSNGDELILELCSRHLRKAVRAGETYASRKFHGPVKVQSVEFHEIRGAYKPHSASAVKELAPSDHLASAAPE